MKVGELISISKGKKELEIPHSNNRIRYIQIEDLRNDNSLKSCESSKKSIFCDKRDLLIAWDGANAGTVGFGLEGVIGSTIARLRPIKEIHTPYFGLFLQSKFNYLRENCTGATIPHISKKSLIELQIPLPPLPIQQKIAAVLDKADAIRKRSQLILAKYDQLAQSVFLEMFGDPVKNEKGWEMKALGEFGNIVTGNTPSRKVPSFYSENSGLEWIKTDNIIEQNYWVTKAQEYLSDEGAKFGRKVPIGSILVACIAGSIKSIGRCALTDREIAFNQQINAITPSKKFNPFFLYWMLCIGRKYIQDQATDGMKRILTKAKFSQIQFPLPSIELQNQFASIIAQIEKQKAQTQLELNRAEELYQSLLQQAFSGELFPEKELIEA